MTGVDLETAAADSVASFVRPKKRPFTQQGQPCKNCGTPLEGWYCHACGQNADTHHRSIVHLIWEAIEGMFHLDGRLANTLPLLFFKPGKLAKDYMEGRIARHVPPFRTFLVSLLLFIFAAEHLIHNFRHEQELEAEKEAHALMTPAGRKAKADEMRQEATEARDERLAAAIEQRDEALKEPTPDKAAIAAEYAEDVKTAEERYASKTAEAQTLQNNPNAGAEALAQIKNKGSEAADQIRSLNFDDPSKLESGATKIAEAQVAGSKVNIVVPSEARIKEQAAASGHETTAKESSKYWFKEGLAKAVANPDYYLLVTFGWAHRLAVLLLPIIGLSLALVYVNRRQYFIYDHLLVATNLLSFSFLLWALVFILPRPLIGAALTIVMLWAPVNLFQTLRGGYGSTIIGALFKTSIVWFSSITAFATMLSGLLLFTLSQM